MQESINHELENLAIVTDPYPLPRQDEESSSTDTNTIGGYLPFDPNRHIALHSCQDCESSSKYCVHQGNLN